MKRFSLIIVLLLALTVAPAEAVKSYSFTAEVWADNWFSMYVNGKKVGEDSVSITTQKSFNSEIIKFTASYPLTIGFIAKDYVQSKSGLEYLGTSNQQIGDGGIIFQVKETASRKLVAFSDDSWKMKVANTAPTNPECEKSTDPDKECKYSNYTIPKSWTSSTFNDKTWSDAKIFTASEVGPKDGYYSISWLPEAKFIWGKDLKLDNVVYFRKKLFSASNVIVDANLDFNVANSVQGNLNIQSTCDGLAKSPPIFWSGIPTETKSLILIMDTIPGPPRPGETQIGNHYYFSQFNISPSKSGFAEGEISPYSPPCSQGPGVKEYRIFLFAMNKFLPNDQKFDGATLYAIGEKDSIAKVTHIYSYARKA